MDTERVKWRAKNVASSNSHVPAKPGLYAIGHAETYHGLEVARTYVYVGKTENLRRRLGQHTPVTEQNPELKTYLVQREHSRCWYTVMDRDNLNEAERDLIRRFRPEFNRAGKPKKEESNG